MLFDRSKAVGSFRIIRGRYGPPTRIGVQILTLDRRPIDPLERRVRAVALAPSELAGVAETARAPVVNLVAPVEL